MAEGIIQCAWCNKTHEAHARVCPSTGLSIRRVDDDDDEIVGKSVDGRYVVRGVLGKGGMGTVYEAEHSTIGKPVALKVLHTAHARKKSAVRRFHQEARAAAAIGHPNICEVYDFGSLGDGRPYIVMERLTGVTLAERIAGGCELPPGHAIEILGQVLSALSAAHDKGIVHRDIKPENVFLTAATPGAVKLLDFGVSKMIGPHRRGEELDLTRPGMVMGTPHYLSPEQARGERDLDARVDVYACGVLLYEALTGRRPFAGANRDALLVQILSAEVAPATTLRPDLLPAFDRVIARAMARARDERYRTASQFRHELEELRRELPGVDAEPWPLASVGPIGPGAPNAGGVSATSVEIPVTFGQDTVSGELTLEHDPGGTS